MTDEELIEAAARMMGRQVSDHYTNVSGNIVVDYISDDRWNPLVCDADMDILLESFGENMTMDFENGCSFAWLPGIQTCACEGRSMAPLKRAMLVAIVEAGDVDVDGELR